MVPPVLVWEASGGEPRRPIRVMRARLWVGEVVVKVRGVGWGLGWWVRGRRKGRRVRRVFMVGVLVLGWWGYLGGAEEVSETR